jgi:hypothetical protein
MFGKAQREIGTSDPSGRQGRGIEFVDRRDCGSKIYGSSSKGYGIEQEKQMT